MLRLPPPPLDLPLQASDLVWLVTKFGHLINAQSAQEGFHWTNISAGKNHLIATLNPGFLRNVEGAATLRHPAACASLSIAQLAACCSHRAGGGGVEAQHDVAQRSALGAHHVAAAAVVVEADAARGAGPRQGAGLDEAGDRLGAGAAARQLLHQRLGGQACMAAAEELRRVEWWVGSTGSHTRMRHVHAGQRLQLLTSS